MNRKMLSEKLGIYRRDDTGVMRRRTKFHECGMWVRRLRLRHVCIFMAPSVELWDACRRRVRDRGSSAARRNRQTCDLQSCDNEGKERVVLQRVRAAVGGWGMRGCVAALGLGAALSVSAGLSGCHNFFVCEKASCPGGGGGGGGGTGSGDYAYISNSASGSTYVAAYDLTGGTLTAISGSPFQLSYIPAAMVVGKGDGYLYIASVPGASTPGIYVYSIGSTGGLTIQNGGSVVISGGFSSIDISPDGNYLFGIESTGAVLDEYSINSSNGLLALVGQIPISGTAGCTIQSGASTPASQSCTVTASPSGNYVAVSLGTAGTFVFPYSSSSGISSSSFAQISPVSTTVGDYSIAMDSSDNAYIARTNQLAVYSITSGPAATQKSTTSYASGLVPRSVTLTSGTNAFVYTANQGAGTISGFSIGSSGALTQLSGSPFTGPTNVAAIGVDNTGDYMVSVGYNATNGVQLFAIGASGALTPVTSAGSGASISNPALLALTH
jgi:6-phosphogluconolactonase